MAELAIKTQGLGKEYRIGARRESYRTLRDLVAGTAARPMRVAQRLLRGERGKQRADERIWALRDVTLEVGRGEVVGIIGRNGAGKSTLLKILSRITRPTAGYAEIDGRVGSLLEVGTGFHQELTGRENILLNGAILGMRRAEIFEKFEEIVQFAEVDRFIDTPVKYYSSGMYLRLAFAVAAHLEPEIMLVDEVLAVGDAAFQRKCIGKIQDVARHNRTVLFVSHNMEAVRGLCHRAVWLDGGGIRADGEVDRVVQEYLTALTESTFSHESKEHGLVIRGVTIRNASGGETRQFHPGEDLVVEVTYLAERPLERPALILLVAGVHGPCFSANMLLDGNQPALLAGEGVLRCRFLGVPLLPQSYSLRMGIRASNGRDSILGLQDVASFTVTGDLAPFGFHGNHMALAARSTPVVIPYEWVLPDGSVRAVKIG
jgi:lipopolysaccharide transport system ATP-binding protein